MQPSEHSDGILWLELTNGCNLSCTHCYAESGPSTHRNDSVDKKAYIEVMREAHDLGFRRIQFIGGEPTLNKDLPEYLLTARNLGFETIEVFSNLFRLDGEVLDALIKSGAQVATSVYSAHAGVHDYITNRKNSHARTAENISRLTSAGVPVFGSFIEMDRNKGQYEVTRAFLKTLCVAEVGHDHVREFGRWQSDAVERMTNLCGACAGNTACVSHDGKVYPCIMSRAWPLGLISEHSLKNILFSEKTQEIRERIRISVFHSTRRVGVCGPQGTCGPSGYHCMPHFKSPEEHPGDAKKCLQKVITPPSGPGRGA